MLTLQRTTAEHPDFIDLVRELDAFLTITDGEEHDFYDQFNSIKGLQYVLVAFVGEEAVGCGAIKPFDNSTMEVKRMYVREAVRGQGFAKQILSELEQWAKELGAERCILETGLRQTSAIALYEKADYQRITNYGQYIGVENSACFEKRLLEQ